MMEQLSQTKAFIHRCLLPKFCRFSPTPTNNKKRPSEFDGKSTPAVEQNPSKRAAEQKFHPILSLLLLINLALGIARLYHLQSDNSIYLKENKLITCIVVEVCKITLTYQ